MINLINISDMKTFNSILFAVIITTLSLQVSAQKRYSVAKATFEVSGTSTVHDWSMKSTEGTGTATITINDSKILDIANLNIQLPAESVKSSKTSMDEVAYAALDTKNNKYIKYTLKSAVKINETVWLFTGIYNIAGVNREYKTQVKATINNGNLVLQGFNQTTFSDFEMSPPTAALGVVKTGKNLTILFHITLIDYAKNENILVIR